MKKPDVSKQTEPAHFPIPALCPKTKGTIIVKLMADLVSKLQRYGPAARVYEIRGDRNDPTTGSPVQQVLAKPVAVFEGIRDHQTGGTCYTGLPTCAYTNGGAKIPPVPGKVYCVYVNPRGHYFESRWEDADPDDAGLPIGYQGRYKQRIWPNQ